jgi:hypothetical protein
MLHESNPHAKKKDCMIEDEVEKIMRRDPSTVQLQG